MPRTNIVVMNHSSQPPIWVLDNGIAWFREGMLDTALEFSSLFFLEVPLYLSLSPGELLETFRKDMTAPLCAGTSNSAQHSSGIELKFQHWV